MRNDSYSEDGIRLQKVLSRAGVASRRAAEELIAQGRVSVDGKVVRGQGMRVDPRRQAIHVDGKRIIMEENRPIVMAVNKPVGMVSTMSANRLTRPSYEIPKTYIARVHGEVKPGVRRRLLEGVELEDGPIAVDSFRTMETYGDITTVEIIVHEGRNRLVRRLMDEVGYPVRELVRTKFGPIRLEHLQPGTMRRVKGPQLAALYDAVGL